MTTPDLLRTVVNHITLPPSLPGALDQDPFQTERDLLLRLRQACSTVSIATQGQFRPELDCLSKSLVHCQWIHASPNLDSGRLREVFQRLSDKEILIVHVTEQNAGLLIRRGTGTLSGNVVFEAFELSAKSEDVLNSRDTLQRDFPTSAAAVPTDVFDDPNFQQALADFLEKASFESIKRFGTVTGKAKSHAFEPRDTVDPALITSLLIALLEGIGQAVAPNHTRKRVRDEVRWKDSKIPWRRSPFWLLLRVGTLRLFNGLTTPSTAQALYKTLVCVLHAQLLDEVVGRLSPAISHLLLSKLCRRLAKLEKDSALVQRNLGASNGHRIVLDNLRPFFLRSSKQAAGSIQHAWDSYRSSIRRSIPQLRSRQAGRNAMTLSLTNSLPRVAQLSRPLTRQIPASDEAMPREFFRFSQKYFDLAASESRIAAQAQTSVFLNATNLLSTTQLAQQIQEYLAKSNGCYEVGTEERSGMILSVMWLWMMMDQHVKQSISVFSRFQPVFQPQVLDCLRLSRLQDLDRLRQIQCHLQKRFSEVERAGCRRTVFDIPARDSFAERYYNDSPDTSELHQLAQSIQDQAEEDKLKKELEWVRLNTEHEKLTKEIARTSCTSVFIEESLIPVHKEHRCRKCILAKRASNVRIGIIERPLPYKDGEAKAVLFELLCPEIFAVYRDATWSIVARLALPNVHAAVKAPLVMARDYYHPLCGDRQIPNAPSLTLGSRTKSFLQTHWQNVYFPVSVDKVCVNNGLKFEYYDRTSKLWPAEYLSNITFHHHCAIPVLRGSPFSAVTFPSRAILQEPGDVGGENFRPRHVATYLSPDANITSNEILAGQSRCPPNLSAQEYMAFQGLVCGDYCLWPSILVELGSSNLNFSTEAVKVLIEAWCGRTGCCQGGDVYTANLCFRDQFFCCRLAGQIERRLQIISSNWRENLCMETLITLILKLRTSGHEDVSAQALQLLESARNITVRWIRTLREEFDSTVDVAASRRLSQFILWASLLCRRTFADYSLNDPQGVWETPRSNSGANDAREEPHITEPQLSFYVEASISMQENLPDKPAAMPPSLRSAVVRDLKMVFLLQGIIRRSMETHPLSIFLAVERAGILSARDNSGQRIELAIRERVDGLWAEVELDAEAGMETQSISFHITAGVLLIDGRGVLKELPQAIRDSEAVVRLFPQQRLTVYPSALLGMTYKLAFNMEGNEIHLGFRDGNLVIRAFARGTLFEFIPSSIFQNGFSSDLPASLVENCFHWLDVRESVIEVRRAPRMWNQRASNWRIDLRSRAAERNRGSRLIDPGSSLFRMFAAMFRGFEEARHITVFQPSQGALSVELRRFELLFFVNGNGFLECPQLRAEIDGNQDAGTWYGLSSKLVLRDVQNPRIRSVIVPLGPVKTKSQGMHVKVEIQTTDPVYGRFFLDETLGRVICAAEPRLLYTKAQLHAHTSFCLPDPLTGRTGADEACHILQSGVCQPYTPLSEGSQALLESIVGVTPARQFYPADLRVLETVSWNKALSVDIQDDRYRGLVDTIKAKSEMLSTFEIKEQTESNRPPSSAFANTSAASVHHLSQRSQIRRKHFQNFQVSNHDHENHFDVLYRSRGYSSYRKSQDHVFQIARLIHQWPVKLPSPYSLQSILETWPFIGGYGDATDLYDRVRLSDQLETDLAFSWGSLVNLFRRSTRDEKYTLLFLSAPICFRETIDMGAIHALTAFAVFRDLRVIPLPPWQSYVQFRPGFCPKPEYLRVLLNSVGRSFGNNSGDVGLTQRERKALKTAEKRHLSQVAEDTEALVSFVCAQWPCAQPSLAGFSSLFLDLDKAQSLWMETWHSMFRNHEFEQHLREVQQVLDGHRAAPVSRFREVSTLELALSSPRGFPLLYGNLLDKEGPPSARQDLGGSTVGRLFSRSAATRPSDRYVTELRQILDEVPATKSVVRKEYMAGLRSSISALENDRLETSYVSQPVEIDQLAQLVDRAKVEVDKHFQELLGALQAGEPGVSWLQIGGLWPLSTRLSVLETLRSTSPHHMSDSMKHAVIHFGLLITKLQRLLRMRDAQRRGKTQLLQAELEDIGHTNWDPRLYPDWLLFEIDSNILIRPIQADVAFATISPASNTNSVLQLNMGQGKTSTIIPLVACVLANGKSLCRIVVPKALLPQTAQLLQSRLGVLLNREIRHFPFSRRASTTSESIQTYWKAHSDILQTSGVIIAIPEHLLSYSLSGQQRISDDRVQEARRMIKVQEWFNKKSRDVLDECDFTLATKTQLVYPSGPQVTIDGGRHRWNTIQAVLQLVALHLDWLQRAYPSSLQVVHRDCGSFPFIYFLRSDVQDALMQQLVSDICDGQTSILKVENLNAPERQAIKTFISENSPSKAATECVLRLHKSDPAVGCVVYLLRGLVVHRILLLTLSRRWNVQYGLHPLRDPVAVPFHAKGVPSDQAEWGHADVSLLFTCLSFYYQGLSPQQFRQALDQILKSDDPARVFEQWVQDSTTIPDQCRNWTSINIEDESQLSEIWRGVRYNIATISYFLNHFVFPKHAKQFTVKLQASGWDLPLAGQGTNITTGFSGTNDNRWVLPLTIKQDDLPALTRTNADVLTYLLHPRNRGYVLAAHRIVTNGRTILTKPAEQELLAELHRRRIRVLIDSGAAILEMTNVELAQKWLDIDHEAAAAVYFDDTNRAVVMSRAGRRMPLLASPYADDLRSCLVYLDESHTRGTDMKFPLDARGAVTLSLGQTKDQTVQAVMRLRQVSTTQSVTFLAPPEVHQSILDFRQKKDGDRIDSRDVLSWLLKQTSQGLENLQPLFYGQGVNYCQRAQAAHDHADFLTDSDQRRSYLSILQDVEKQTLPSLYHPRTARSSRSGQPLRFSGTVAEHIKQLEKRRHAFRDTGTAVHASALHEVEQEREVVVEVEAVRELQKPMYFHPYPFTGLDDDIKEFVQTGHLRKGSLVCENAFSYLRGIRSGQKHALSLPTTSRFLVSLEFRRTVYVPAGKSNDDFLRPVRWILWSTLSETAVLVSPEEAEHLVPLCRDPRNAAVHLLTYATPVTRQMLEFNNMDYYAIPALPSNWSAPMWFKVQVGIFAGRLYFPFDELQHIRAFLNLRDGSPASRRAPDDIDGEAIDRLLVSEEDQHAEERQRESTGTFNRRPSQAHDLRSIKTLSFLHEWLTIRSKGQEFTHTPMGYICSRKLLEEDHPFFRGFKDTARRIARATAAGMKKDDAGARGEDEDALDFDDELDDRQKLTEEELIRPDYLDEEDDSATLSSNDS